MATATASSYGESTSVFEARLQASGIPNEDAKKIKAHISTLKQLAFVSSFTPAQADEKPLMDELEAMLGRRPETGVKASFRALFHESYAVVTSEMRQRVERSEEVQVRRLSQRKEQNGTTSKCPSSKGSRSRDRLSPRKRWSTWLSVLTKQTSFAPYRGTGALPGNKRCRQRRSARSSLPWMSRAASSRSTPRRRRRLVAGTAFVCAPFLEAVNGS